MTTLVIRRFLRITRPAAWAASTAVARALRSEGVGLVVFFDGLGLLVFEGIERFADFGFFLPPFLQALFVFLICLLVGQGLYEAVAQLGLRLPQFVWSLIVGVAIRNIGESTGWIRIRRRATEVIGAMSLWLFLAMALMSLQIWELAALAGPLLVIVAAQTGFMTLFAILVTFRVMGGNYEAAVLAGGHCGFGMGATPTAIANMEAVTGRHGPAPEAMIVVPMVGAFFIDLLNTGVITGFLALPLFGFG